MMYIVLLCAVLSQDAVKPYEIEQLYEYVNFSEISYTDSLRMKMNRLYQKIKAIDLREYTEDQKCDIVFFMGIYRSKKIYKQVDEIINSKTKNDELLGMCYFYKYQIGDRKYLNLYLECLEKQRKSVGDTKLIPPLAFIKDRNIALDYLNRYVVNADGAQAELIYETCNIIKTISKDDKIFLKYPNLSKYIK